MRRPCTCQGTCNTNRSRSRRCSNRCRSRHSGSGCSWHCLTLQRCCNNGAASSIEAWRRSPRTYSASTQTKVSPQCAAKASSSSTNLARRRPVLCITEAENTNLPSPAPEHGFRGSLKMGNTKLTPPWESRHVAQHLKVYNIRQQTACNRCPSHWSKKQKVEKKQDDSFPPIQHQPQHKISKQKMMHLLSTSTCIQR